MTRQFLATALTVVLTAGTAFAQETPGSRTVRIGEALVAGGQTLQPGSYRIRLVGPSASAAQREVEILSGETVVARETAELSTAAGVAGTSGGSGAAKVEKLKGGEFVRISFTEGGVRYLVHLSVPGAAPSVPTTGESRYSAPFPVTSGN